MEIGISSACFYPMLIEDSLRNVGILGAGVAEVFINSECELSGSILEDLCAIKNKYSINVRSIHPFTSAYETVLLFSGYERRTLDGIKFYEKYFRAAKEFGAEAVVLHGGKSVVPITPEAYAKNYRMLLDKAEEYGIYVAHENVRDHHCSDPLFMKKVADLVGDDFRMVLDIKQCRRSRQSEFDFIDLLGDKIIQVHLSDCVKGHDCLPPGEGYYDFGKLFSALDEVGYDKGAVIEIYASDYKDMAQMRKAKTYLENMQ